MRGFSKEFVLIVILTLFLAACTNSEEKKVAYLNKKYTSVNVTKEERVSMRMISLLMDAFEKRDVILLKSISAAHQSKNYSDIKKEFEPNKKRNFRNFRLHNVEVLNTTPIISGEFTYSCDLDNPDGAGNLTNISTLNFAVGQRNGKSLIVAEPSGKKMEYSLRKQSEGQSRFGVEDIRKLN
jgi:hypothetical protein